MNDYDFTQEDPDETYYTRQELDEANAQEDEQLRKIKQLLACLVIVALFLLFLVVFVVVALV